MNKTSCCTDLTTASGACLTNDGALRFRLWRRWGTGKMLGFVMLNPSIANAHMDDHTIRKCKGFAIEQGYDGIEVVNLFPFVSTDPSGLARYDASEHEAKNMRHIKDLLTKHDTVLGFGDFGAAAPAHRRVLQRLISAIGETTVYCLGTTKRGFPKHPGRLGYATPSSRWMQPGFWPSERLAPSWRSAPIDGTTAAPGVTASVRSSRLKPHDDAFKRL